MTQSYSITRQAKHRHLNGVLILGSGVELRTVVTWGEGGGGGREGREEENGLRRKGRREGGMEGYKRGKQQFLLTEALVQQDRRGAWTKVKAVGNGQRRALRIRRYVIKQ